MCGCRRDLRSLDGLTCNWFHASRENSSRAIGGRCSLQRQGCALRHQWFAEKKRPHVRTALANGTRERQPKDIEGRQPLSCCTVVFFVCWFVFFYPIYYLRPASPAPFLSIVLRSTTGSHSEHSSPLPPTVRVFEYYRDKSSAVSSLVDLRRIARTHARRFSASQFLHKKKMPTRWVSNSRNRPW